MSTNQTETPRQRLDRLRAEVAQRTQAASAELPVRPADTFHCLVTGVTISLGNGFMSTAHITTAGENIIVTQNMIAASYDNFGQSWMAIIDDDDAQVQRWGEVRFRIGPAPADARTWNTVGDVEWTRARDAAKAEAWAMPTAEARAAALAEVNARFGPIASTANYWISEDPSVAAAAAQQKALDEGGIRFSQHVEAKEAGAKR
ncbi:hypothetical protein [Microbacterium sp. NPDC079176]|uniref:hypothetical protein n=1 Tax=Microbacterium sp. NPDC079176 TaxID=3154768 RepID=UPI00342B82C3